MMVDGNVIIYERIKDEYREGKSLLAAYHAGFKKATKAIVDGNVTTIFAALMLLFFGTGTVSGFGVTLLIGLVLSVFASLVLTRFLLKWTIAIWGDNPKLYRLHRKAGFNEADEEQYVPIEKPKKVRKEKVVEEELKIEEKVETSSEDDFDKLFGDIGGN